MSDFTRFFLICIFPSILCTLLFFNTYMILLLIKYFAYLTSIQLYIFLPPIHFFLTFNQYLCYLHYEQVLF